MSIAGFVCGLVSGVLVLLLGASFPTLGLCIAVPAVVFSAIGLKKDNKKQVCVCGLAFGIITSLFYLVNFIFELIALVLLLLSLMAFE